MSKEDLSRVARFYGISEEELIRRQGDVLEISLQDFKSLMADVILEKIIQRPEAIKPEVIKGIVNRINSA